MPILLDKPQNYIRLADEGYASKLPDMRGRARTSLFVASLFCEHTLL
jgi:hypothetical protein